MNTVRDTSLMTYFDMKKEGVYGSRMLEVFDAIRECPLMTGREYATLILNKSDMNEVRPRISDLKDLNLIREVGKRKCSISKRLCYVWEVIKK